MCWREDSETGEVLQVSRYIDSIREGDEESLEEKKMKVSTIVKTNMPTELRSGLVVYNSSLHSYLKLEKLVQGSEGPA